MTAAQVSVIARLTQVQTVQLALLLPLHRAILIALCARTGLPVAMALDNLAVHVSFDSWRLQVLAEHWRQHGRHASRVGATDGRTPFTVPSKDGCVAAYTVDRYALERR